MNKEINQEQLHELEKIANKLRLKVIEMLYHAKSGHPGGALSSAEVVSALYFTVYLIANYE